MVALGTGTVTEVAALAVATGRRVRERGVLVATWFCLGWAVHAAGLFVSALLGVDHVVLANLAFVLAVVAQVVSLVLMVQAVAPRRDGPARERTIDVVTLSVGPFLAVYAVWGFVDDEVSALFRSNYLLLGLGDVQRWSISLSNERLPFYLWLAAAGWVLRALVRHAQRRRPRTGVAVVGVVAEAVWALALFVVLIVVARAVHGWLRDRVVWAELTAAGQSVLAALPELELPFGATLRGLAADLVTVAPGVLATVLLLPLMWLALAATVYGWRDYRAADLVVGTRFAGAVDRLGRLQRTPTGRLVALATEDLRTKYVPVAQALRMIARAGPRLVGAYLLLATVVSALHDLLEIGLTLVVGPRTAPVTLLVAPTEDLVVGLVTAVLSFSLYAAAFERALEDGASRAQGDQRPAAEDLQPGEDAALLVGRDDEAEAHRAGDVVGQRVGAAAPAAVRLRPSGGAGGVGPRAPDRRPGVPGLADQGHVAADVVEHDAAVEDRLGDDDQHQP